MFDYKKIVLKNSPVPGALPQEEFLDYGEIALNYADKKIYYKTLNNEIVVHETPNISVTGEPNTIVRRNLDGSGIFNGIFSETNDDSFNSIVASHSLRTTAIITNTGPCTAAEISSPLSIGAEISSVSSIGAKIYSTSNIGGLIYSASGIGAEIYSTSNTGAKIYSTTGIGATIDSGSGLALRVSSTTGNGVEITTGNTVESSYGLSIVASEDAIGLVVETNNNSGANIHSAFNTGAEIYTENGDYHATFGNISGLQQVGISSESTIDWLLFGSVDDETPSSTCKLEAPPSPSDDHVWKLPDGSGILLLDNSSGGNIITVDSVSGTDIRDTLDKNSSIPFETIETAVEESAPEDTIIVNPGEYTIASKIILDGAANNIYFSPGTIITVDNATTGIVAFELTADESKSIFGYANFICDNIVVGVNNTMFSQSFSGTPTSQKMFFECNSISGTSGGNIFSIASGECKVSCKNIVCQSATVINNIGISTDINYDVETSACSKLLNTVGGANVSNINIFGKDVDVYGTDGVSIIGGNVSLKIVGSMTAQDIASKLINLTFENSNTTSNVISLHGGSYIANTAACITHNATTATNKTIKLSGDVFLKTNATNSITSVASRQILLSSAHSNKAASNITFTGGTYLVNVAF